MLETLNVSFVSIFLKLSFRHYNMEYQWSRLDIVLDTSMLNEFLCSAVIKSNE